METSSSKHDDRPEANGLSSSESITNERSSERTDTTTDFVDGDDRSEQTVGWFLECCLETRPVDDSTENTVILSNEQEACSGEAWGTDGYP